MVHENSLPPSDRNDYEPPTYLTARTLTSQPEPDTRLFENAAIISPKAVWLNADQHGWHNPPATLPEDLLLIHSEISEACEGYRAGKKNFADGKGSVEEELADAVIRIFHVSEKHGIDICAAVLRKHTTNINRPYRHGGKKL